MEEHDENRSRDIVLGKLYDALLTAQHFAEMAGLEQMARGLREMRRRTYVTTVLGAQNKPNDPRDAD